MISQSNKHYKVKTIEANLYVRKITVADHVLTAIEKTLIKTPAVYRYTEVLPRTCLATTGTRSCSHEDFFSKEPVRRMVFEMATNQAYLRTNRTKPLHYQKFNLSQIVFYRNCQRIVGTTVSTNFNHHIYFNTLVALDFLEKIGHGITLDNYPNQFVLSIDSTSTQETSHDFIHPELTNRSISVQFTFDRALPAKVEMPFLGERSSIFFINLKRKMTMKNPTITYSTDEIRYLFGKCIHFKYYFYGNFAGDNFPKQTIEGFIIVNASRSQHAGSHWMVILFHENKVYLADPLGVPIQNYHLFYCRLLKFYHEVTQILNFKSI